MTDDMVRDEEPVSLLGRRSLVNALEEPFSYNGDGRVTAPKKRRTLEDFKLFCQIVLQYANYESDKDESDGNPQNSKGESSRKSDNNLRSTPRRSIANTMGGLSSDDDDEEDEDSYDMVTCYCGKPFANRPMIECSRCLTWIHLRCAKVRKSDIPDVFICSSCRYELGQ